MNVHSSSGAIGGMAGAYGEERRGRDLRRRLAAARRRDAGATACTSTVSSGRTHLVRALHPEELDEPVELAFVATKSHHTEAPSN